MAIKSGLFRYLEAAVVISHLLDVTHTICISLKKKRKHKSKEKWKNATFPKRSTPDTWMKTSSLPNIKQKIEIVELGILPQVNQNVMDSNVHHDSKSVRSKAEVTDVEEHNTNGVDNLGS